MPIGEPCAPVRIYTHGRAMSPLQAFPRGRNMILIEMGKGCRAMRGNIARGSRWNHFLSCVNFFLSVTQIHTKGGLRILVHSRARAEPEDMV